MTKCLCTHCKNKPIVSNWWCHECMPHKNREFIRDDLSDARKILEKEPVKPGHIFVDYNVIRKWVLTEAMKR